MAVIFLEMVDPKGFEPSTSRMRTERSPKADILQPRALYKLKIRVVLLNFRHFHVKNITFSIQHLYDVLFKTQALITSYKTPPQDFLPVSSGLFLHK